LQIGVVFPQTEIGADVGGVRAYIQAVAEMGYKHLLPYDHVVGADPGHHTGWTGPYTHKSMFHEPFVLFGYAAALAPEMELVSGVFILPQRQAVLVAKQAAEVDVLANGKLRLGVGIGWNHVEYEALGMRFENRARRFEEQIELMRRLWTDPVITFEGRYHKVTAAGLNPMPVQRPIPLWIGGSAEPALKRAAVLGDGFFPQRPLENSWAKTLDRMREWREEAGKSWDGYGLEARVNAGQGTPWDWQRTHDEWQALGATHMSVNTMGAGLVGVDAHIQRLRDAKTVLGV
jgi:probable F420-dependent oxidoreductase